MQEGGAGQPGHKHGVFYRVPTPEAAPTQHIISPPPTEDQTDGQENPGNQRPASRGSNPLIFLRLAGDESCHGESKGNDKTGKTDIGGGWVADHAKMPQQRIEALAIFRDVRYGIDGLENGRG